MILNTSNNVLKIHKKKVEVMLCLFVVNSKLTWFRISSKYTNLSFTSTIAIDKLISNYTFIFIDKQNSRL